MNHVRRRSSHLPIIDTERYLCYHKLPRSVVMNAPQANR
jgi:hypothetical protein